MIKSYRIKDQWKYGLNKDVNKRYSVELISISSIISFSLQVFLTFCKLKMKKIMLLINLW